VAFCRPDGRWFVRSPHDDEPDVDLYANVAEDEIAEYVARGFVVQRRENHYLVPTETVLEVEPPAGVELVTADRVEVDRLRELDDELRQDVPGSRGWRWEAVDFRAELAGADFDPTVYIVAVDGEEYVGIARVWMRRPIPRLGFVGVSRPYRRRGVALALLSRAFGTLASRGIPEVTTEIDETNTASRGLLEGLGARRVGGSVELVLRRESA
jgi:ribosomal protein S18 acetylase RimI-like enzyme